jgi:hypothetical protein
MNEDYIYVRSHYFGTGEGMTLGLLVTRALPNREQYDNELSRETVALMQFDETFGSFLGRGAVAISKHTFLTENEDFIPKHVKQIVNGGKQTPGNFKWSAEVHINYS